LLGIDLSRMEKFVKHSFHVSFTQPESFLHAALICIHRI